MQLLLELHVRRWSKKLAQEILEKEKACDVSPHALEDDSAELESTQTCQIYIVSVQEQSMMDKDNNPDEMKEYVICKRRQDERRCDRRRRDKNDG